MRSARSRSGATGGRPAPAAITVLAHLPPQPCPAHLGGRLLHRPHRSLQKLYVFFFITHGCRRLVHLNVTAHSTAEWVWRQLIAATPWGIQPSFLIRDRDRCYGGAFIPRAARLGIETLLTSVQAPKANAIAERLVGTLRRECVDHFIIFNERHLRRVVKEYAQHYNRGRPHRSLDLAPPDGLSIRLTATGGGRVKARPSARWATL